MQWQATRFINRISWLARVIRNDCGGVEGNPATRDLAASRQPYISWVGLARRNPRSRYSSSARSLTDMIHCIQHTDDCEIYLEDGSILRLTGQKIVEHIAYSIRVQQAIWKLVEESPAAAIKEDVGDG